MFAIFSVFNSVALDMRLIRWAEVAVRAEVVFFDSFCRELTAREDAVRDVVARFVGCVVAVVFSRGFTACFVVVREVVFC